MQQQKTQRTALYFGIGLIALFALFMYNGFRVTQKQKHIIELKEKETQEQKHIIEEKHKEINDSINYAERIQRSFLATEAILDKNLKDYFVLFKPKATVSGDFYWAAELNNGNFAFVTADSTGHGVPGAIMSLLNITSLEKAIENHTDPAEILNHTRKTIIERLKKDGSADGGKDGMDCSLMIFDFKRSKLAFAAAHNPVWIIHSGEGKPAIAESLADKMPVGKHANDHLSFTCQTLDLKKGDMIYAITDGFADQFGGPKGKKYMQKRLKELLISVSAETPAKQKQVLSETLTEWIGDLEQVDDITVVGIRVS
jgi:serine phosphatase RsbU (regulator of sigma subunit)